MTTLTNYVNTHKNNEVDTIRIMKMLIEIFIHQETRNLIFSPNQIIINGIKGKRVASYSETYTPSDEFDVFDFSAPEVIRGSEFDIQKAVCFSIGSCMFYAFTGFNPFDADGSTIERHILNQNFQIKFETINHHANISNFKKPYLIEIIKSLLKYHPNERASLENIQKSPFFYSDDKIINTIKDLTDKDVFINFNEYHRNKYDCIIREVSK